MRELSAELTGLLEIDSSLCDSFIASIDILKELI
jgi:hypothetical protein